MILASDTFNRSSGTLGASWTEHGGTNISCDGSSARIDSAPQAHIATALGTSQQSTYFQCWLRGSDAANLVGLCWRFQNTTNYYTVRANNTFWSVFRVGGSGGTDQIGTNFGTVTTWHRIAVRHIGTRIQVYLDQSYDTSFGREGPAFDEVDPDAQGSAWTGSCGIISASNNATGITNLKWNDFIAFDGTPETIYVDTTFNGGSPGEGMGTADRPDLHIDWALNNAGLGKGGKLKFLQDGPITNPTGSPAPAQFVIGHANKFSDAGFTYPEYSPGSGTVTVEGSPNLIIEGRDGGRTILREVSDNRYFFTMRGDARGVVFRGLDFEATARPRYVHAPTGSGDRSFTMDKCRIDEATGAAVGISVAQCICTFVRLMYNYFTGGTAFNTVMFSASGGTTRIRRFEGMFNLSDAKPQTMFSAVTTVDPADTWVLDHNTMYHNYTGVFGTVTLYNNTLAQNNAGLLTAKNNIVSLLGSNHTSSIALVATATSGAPAGDFVSHHNGLSGRSLTDCWDDVALWSDFAQDICAPGVDTGTSTPQYTDEAGVTTWEQTAGWGVNGEGTFAALVVKNLRPQSPLYLDTADDSDPLLGVLDRGALQSFFVAPVTPGASLPITQARIFCPSVIFDLDGPQQFDLSGRVIQMTPIRYERDILLRSYRANDVSVEFMDTEGLFLESNPDSFLLDSTGQPNWLGKPVIITAIYGDEQLHQFQGFVLEVQAGRGTGVLRLGNRFQELFDRPVLANDVVRIVATNQATVHPRTSGDATTAGYHSREGITIHLDARPTVETLTFEFQDATRFIVTGSVSGHEGEGSIESAFTTISGSVTISGGETDTVHSGTAHLGGASSIFLQFNTSSSVDDFYNGDTIFLNGGTGVGQSRTIIDYDASAGIPPFNHRADVDTPWVVVPDSTTTYEIISGVPTWNQGFHTYAEGERVTITIGWASSRLENPPETNADRPIVDIYREFLLSDQAGMLDASDLDQASIAAIEGSRANQLARPFVVDRPEKVIESLDDLSLHMGAVTIEKANAKMALTSVMPRIVPAGSLDLLCHGDDLMAAETEHLPIYNQFVSVFDYDVATQGFLDGVNFPVRRSDNPSYARYGRILPAPRTFEFRSYSDEIVDNGSWVTLILEVLYRRYENPTLVIKAKAKLSRFGAELDDLYEVDSEVPTTHVDAMEPFAIDKLLTDDLSVRLELVDVSAIVQEEGECGYLSYDTPGQGYDQCWGYF